MKGSSLATKHSSFAIGGAAFAAAILSLALPLSAADQSRAGKAPAAGAHKLVALKATGTTRFTDKEILAASGLELGQNAAAGDFQEAAQRLGNSGLFSNVLYSFSYSDNGMKVEFQLTDVDASKLVPVHFENFVWFAEPELRASVEQRVPLFKDALPANGHMADEITRALQAILVEGHLPGRVDYLREAKPDGGDITGIVYRILDLSIRIRNVEFPGASADETAFLAPGARKLAGAEYSRSMLATVARYDLLPLFLQRGYLKAAFGPADAHVVTESAAATEGKQQEDKPQDEIEVDATVPVMPGPQYSVSEVSWKGNSAVTTKEGAPLIHLAIGQPADAVRLGRDVESLIKLYRSRGYMRERERERERERKNPMECVCVCVMWDKGGGENNEVKIWLNGQQLVGCVGVL